MEFLQKAPDCVFHMTMATLPQQLRKSLQHILRAHSVITEGWCKTTTRQHQPATAAEYTRLLCDPETSNLGGFGPKHIVSTHHDMN